MDKRMIDQMIASNEWKQFLDSEEPIVIFHNPDVELDWIEGVKERINNIVDAVPNSAVPKGTMYLVKMEDYEFYKNLRGEQDEHRDDENTQGNQEHIEESRRTVCTQREHAESRSNAGSN